MSTIGDRYVLGDGRSDHDRLRVISEIHDDRTRELLLRAGFAPGHEFVEFGCGLGYVTRWAAATGARATGIDVNPEQIAVAQGLATDAGLQTAHFRLGSIYEPGLPHGSVDMSYSRWLMVHLNRPVDAMRAIHSALKPGGVMVCEEADVSAVYAEPRSAAYEELRDICLDAGPARGCVPSPLCDRRAQGVLELDVTQCRSEPGDGRQSAGRSARGIGRRHDRGRRVARHARRALPDAPGDRQKATVTRL